VPILAQARRSGEPRQPAPIKHRPWRRPQAGRPQRGA